MSRFDDSNAEANQDVSGVGASGAGVTSDVAQAQGATGSLQTGFTETGQSNMSDVNVQELQSTANALMTASMATLKASLDSVSAARATNAAIVDNMSQLNSVHLNNLVNSASHRHSEIATDRQWNINETDFYAVVAAAVAAAMAEKSFEV